MYAKIKSDLIEDRIVTMRSTIYLLNSAWDKWVLSKVLSINVIRCNMGQYICHDMFNEHFLRGCVVVTVPAGLECFVVCFLVHSEVNSLIGPVVAE